MRFNKIILLFKENIIIDVVVLAIDTLSHQCEYPSTPNLSNYLRFKHSK